MESRFSYFVILASMRTGSNFLEENLNDYPGLCCHGELFNPGFVGKAGQDKLFGTDLFARSGDPLGFLDRAIARTEGMAGFRLFQDHDPRVLAHVLKDAGAAKIVLTRNPVESYVSRKIAAATGQWRLGEMKAVRTARVRFDPVEFETYLEDVTRFRAHVLRELQTSGQSAFILDYEDLGDLEVLNGLARYLGVPEGKPKISTRTKKQNPEPLEARVENLEDMTAALSRIDYFAIGPNPAFEPRRGPGMARHVAAARASLLFLPLETGPWQPVEDWLAALDGVETGELQRSFTQRTLRKWMRAHPGHRSFTVLRPPAERLYSAFRNLASAPSSDLVRAITKTYRVPFPEDGRFSVVGAERAAFLAFLEFVAGNLGGQTGLAPHPSWSTQAAFLLGLGQFLPPDAVLRSDRLATGLAWIASEVGRQPQPLAPVSAVEGLDAIHDGEIAAAVRKAHRRDFVMFGFEDWRAG